MNNHALSQGGTKVESRWYRLDNAAKIYPIVASPQNSNVYRIAANIKQEVEPAVLQQAVTECKPRFPSIYVRLRMGMFWYYYESNSMEPVVKPESPYINQMIDLQENNGYYFTVSYYRNRINLEMFHSICDGYGTLEFLKAILFRYFELLGYPMDSEGMVITLDQTPKQSEIEDSFIKNYIPTARSRGNVQKAYHNRGTHFHSKTGIGVINGKLPSSQLRKIAKDSGATVSQYLTALVTYSIFEADAGARVSARPVNISVPVNLRNYFNSRTLRNFSLFFHTSICGKSSSLEFQDILSVIREQFVSELDKEKLQQNLNANVSVEKNIVLRAVPLFMKWVPIKIAYATFGRMIESTTISNLGNIELPKCMESLVSDFEFNLNTGYDSTHNISVVSCNGKTTISFSRTVYETDIERVFFSHLSSSGADIEIESNLWEDFA